MPLWNPNVHGPLIFMDDNGYYRGKQGNSCWMLLVPKDTVFVDDQKFYVFGDDFGQPPGA